MKTLEVYENGAVKTAVVSFEEFNSMNVDPSTYAGGLTWDLTHGPAPLEIKLTFRKKDGSVAQARTHTRVEQEDKFNILDACALKWGNSKRKAAARAKAGKNVKEIENFVNTVMFRG